jgi:hypothetical protein
MGLLRQIPTAGKKREGETEKRSEGGEETERPFSDVWNGKPW